MRTHPFLAVLALLCLTACGSGSDTTITKADNPTISGVAPTAGPPAGGTTITLAGSGYQSGATVLVGGVPATGVAFVSSVEITAVTPPGSGSVTVVVENPDGSAVAKAGAFTYGPPPVLTGIDPTALPTPGGSTAVVSGSGFSTNASVAIGGNPCVVQARTPTQITVLVPAGTAGATTVTVTNDDGQMASVAATYDDPPVIVATGAPTSIRAGTHTTFGVTATDPEGQTVGVTLLNPPTGATMTPATGAGSAAATVRWQPTSASAGLHTLVFRAEDAAGTVGTLHLAVQVSGDIGSGLMVGDVTGDGILDVIASARVGDTHVPDAGYLAVWAGATTISGPPTAFLRVAAAVANDQLGYVQTFGWGERAPSMQLCDVTGDGTLDIVVLASLADVGTGDTGACYVWAGGPGLVGTQDATASLHVPGATSSLRIGWMIGQGSGLLCCDVSGDGIADVIVGSPQTLTTVPNAGAIYVWLGGAGLTGVSTPDATCTVPGAASQDYLGRSEFGQGLLCCDILGDGTLDIVAVTPYADVGGFADTGAVYVFAGGAGMSGAVGPTAAFSAPATSNSQLMGRVQGTQGVLCCDVTGDGRADIVAASMLADVGAPDAGAVYVFAGGASVSGAVGPTATLARTSPTAGDTLTYAGGCNGLYCCDVTNDGILDVIALGSRVDANASDSGGVYVWAGGSGLTGTPAPTASLEVAAPTAGDRLGDVSVGTSLVCCDVAGDGALDLIVSSYWIDTTVVDAGAAYVWLGGTALTGTVAPVATLQRPTPVANDYLGLIDQGIALHCCDVTGDSRADVVLAGHRVDTTVPDAGEILVWAGATGLSGTPAPTATLQVAGAAAGDMLGFTQVHGGLQCCDVTGDGVLDIVAAASRADTTTTDAGAVYVWNGGGTLTGVVAPTATLQIDAAFPSDMLGESGTYAYGSQGVLCCDVTGDGVLDLVVAARQADVPTPNAGAVFVWAGGALTGTPLPTARVRRAAPGGNDLLGDINSGQGLLCADVDGDGTADLVMGSYLADMGAGDSGGIFIARGGSGLSGTVFPSEHALLSPTGNDWLGR